MRKAPCEANAQSCSWKTRPDRGATRNAAPDQDAQRRLGILQQAAFAQAQDHKLRRVRSPSDHQTRDIVSYHRDSGGRFPNRARESHDTCADRQTAQPAGSRKLPEDIHPWCPSRKAPLKKRRNLAPEGSESVPCRALPLLLSIYI